MTGTGALRRRAREARDWLNDACFPLWAKQGLEGAGFCEALDLQHESIFTGTARTRVQARQTYVFASAKQLGWDPDTAQALVETGLNAFADACPQQAGLFTRQIDLASRQPISETIDLYDTAFALFALAAAYEVGADTSERMEAICAGLDAHLADPSGGYAEMLPRPSHRLQNPHMHLFEAFLQAFEATKSPAYLERATGLQQLCLNRFIDPEIGTIGEAFEPSDWSRAKSAIGQIVEPGHQFEWVWLFEKYARLAGVDIPKAAQTLYRFACSTLDDAGGAVQAVKRDGSPHDSSRRTWPQTEALKAHLTMHRAGDEDAAARAVRSFDLLMDVYLTSEGGWKDHVAADGSLLSKNMPASTGYHVVVAFLDLIETFGA